MKIWMFMLTQALTLALSALQPSPTDKQVHEEIIQAVQTADFSQTTVYYVIGGKSYPIFVVNNPQRAWLWGHNEDKPRCESLLFIANLPAHHRKWLEEKIREEVKDQEIFISLNGKHHISDFSSIKPIKLTESISDPIIDEQIAQLFRTTDFAKGVFYYHISDEFYKVCLLHNPQEENFQKLYRYRTEAGKPLKELLFKWNDRYGIAVDKKAPEELVSHIAYLASASSWDWLFNFSIWNGGHITAEGCCQGKQGEKIASTQALEGYFQCVMMFEKK